MSKTVLSRFGGAATVALGLYLKPKLAADAKFDLTPFFKDVTKKNYPGKKTKIAQDVKAALNGKLAKDASLQDLTKMLDHLEDAEVAEGTDENPETGLPMSKEEMEKKAKDEKEKAAADRKAAMDAFRAGCSDEQRKAFDAIMEGGEDAEAKAAEKDAEGEERKSAEDEAKEKEEAEKKAASDKRAHDAQIDGRIKAEGEKIRKEMRDIQQAYTDVEPWVGRLQLGMDSAAAVYRTALKGLGMDAKKVDGMHDSALKDVLEAQPKPGERKSSGRIAQDGQIAGTTAGFASRWGDATSRIGAA